MAIGITNWQKFVESSRSFFDANRDCPMFQLVETLDEMYRVAHAYVPFPKSGQEQDEFLHVCFLICHRALLSGATSTGSGLPEDGPAITRRALEAAKVCFAVKADSANLTEWKSTDRRKARWESRQQGKFQSGPVTPKYKGVFQEPLYDELQDGIGVLSDFAVHFTPEHVHNYEWEQSSNPDGTTDTAFGVGENAVTSELLMMAGLHRLIFRVFDHCLDGKLLAHPAVQSLARRALAQYKDLLQREGHIEEASTAGERW